MSKIIKRLFGVADFLAWLGMGSSIIATVATVITALTYSRSEGVLSPAITELLPNTWLGVSIEILTTAILVLGCYLHIRRFAVSVALIVIALVVKAIFALDSVQLSVLLIMMAIFVAPWAMMYLEVRRIKR